MNKNLKKLVFASLLIAIAVVLTRLVTGYTFVIAGAQVRLNLGFIAIMYAGYLLGPVYGASVGALADLIGFFVNPMGGGGYFPGFTVTSGLVGFVPGLIHGKWRENTYIIIAIFFLIGISATILNSVWLALAFGANFWATFLTRLIAGALSSAINTLCMFFLLKLKLPIRF